jgi:HemK-like putative methylase
LARKIGQAFDETGPKTAKLKMLDLCTGSAPIPLLLAYLLQQRIAKLYALDLAPEAVKLAQDNLILQRKLNARMPSIDIWQASILSSTFVQDSLTRMKGPIDILTANPPYISTLEYASLPSSVKDHEDSRALIAEEKGLQFYSKIAEILPRLLSQRGDVDAAGIPRVAVEIGHEQADRVRDILQSKSEGRIARTECWRDQWDKDRLIVGYGR